MKHFIKLIAICFCLFLSGTTTAQKKLSDKKNSTIQTTTKYVAYRFNTQKKLEPYNKARITKTTYKTTTFGIKIPQGRKKIALPPKTIDIKRIVEGPEWGWGWIHKKKTIAQNIEGVAGRTNVHYFKNIRKGTFTSFSNDFDHIVVTDTLYAPTSFLNTDGKPRREKRSYIKIIANCIIYESPIKLSSVKLRTQTDYVFSADKIFFKTKHKGLQKMKVGSSPPFVVADGKIKLHKDPFVLDEKILVNRLFIEIMRQITTELNAEKNVWKKDKLLIEFQKYRYKVRVDNVLWKDLDYIDEFNKLCNDFDYNQESSIERVRTVNDLNVIVEGKVKDLDKNPFKYYVIPSKATLVPIMDENTGVLNKLGDLIFRATSDSKLTVNMEVKLGYQKELLEKANEELNKYGFILEKSIPKKILFIDEQPLQIRGQKTGRIIPVDSDILMLKLELQDENLSLIKLLAKNDVSFNLNFKAYDSRYEYPQKALFEVSDDIIKQIDYKNMIGEFNVIETNTVTDLVKITSNLSSNLGAEKEGILNYIEVSLEFQFDNEKVVFRGPFKMSSASVLGSENSILFIKHSENYSIKVTGKAYYENGIREIKDNLIITSPFIELNEDIFKDSMDN